MAARIGDSNEGLSMLKKGVIALVFIAIVSGALAIALADFTDQIGECATGFTYNETSNLCNNSTNSSQPDLSPVNRAFNITEDGTTGLGNATGFLTTIGTLLGVAALVGIVVGAFMLLRS